MKDLKNAKRVIMISDIHFGARANSMEWFNIMKDYFENFFIPLIQKEKRPGDVLFCLGDVFDNRQSVNILIGQYVMNLFARLGEIMDVHIIVGNHDIYRKNTNEINSVESFKYLPGVKVYTHAELIDLGSKKALMMPWRRDRQHEIDTLAKYPNANYVFCHSEFQGVQLSRNPKNKHNGGNDVDNFKTYDNVYSGHIHYRQKKKNFLLVGNPYEMTRSDIGNTKGVYILDIATGEEEFFANDYSPKFMKLNLKDILEMSIGDLKDKINNNFIDLFISSEAVMKYNLSALMNLIEGSARKIEPHIYENETEIDLMMNDTDDSSAYKNFDILTIAKRYIDATTYELPMKQKLLGSIKELYNEVNN